MTEKSCCEGSKCENFCFDDPDYIEKCIQISCCDGYCRDCCDDCCSPSRERLDNCCYDCSFQDCCSFYYIFYYWLIPMFVLIIVTFWMMIIFFALVIPPMIFALLGLPFLRAKKFEVFKFIEKEEVRADTSDNVKF